MPKKIPLIYSQMHKEHKPSLGEGFAPHPEQAYRIELIKNALVDANLGVVVSPEKFDPELLKKIHDADYLDFLSTSSSRPIPTESGERRDLLHESWGVEDSSTALGKTEYLDNLKQYSHDISSPVTNNTYECALAAAAVAYTAARKIQHKEKLVYALTRPPGHHAGKSTMGGFCYLNNAALAAFELSQAGNVAILDIDYHHGNGTQEIVLGKPNVSFTSLHADAASEYPYNPQEASLSAYHIYNFPLPAGTLGKDYLFQLIRALAIISENKPQFLVVSVGFDTYEKDLVGNFRLTLPDYKIIGHLIGGLKLPTVLIQEGGYHDDLGKAAVGFVSGLLSD